MSSAKKNSKSISGRGYKKIRKKKAIASQRPDMALLAVTLGLLVFGAVTVYNASLAAAYYQFGGKYHFLAYQLIWVALGLTAGTVLYLADYHKLEKFFYFGLLATMAFLFVTSWGGLAKIPVLGFPFSLLIRTSFYQQLCPLFNGARRWIVFTGRARFQPAEMLKLFLIGTLSFWLARVFSPRQGYQGRGAKKPRRPDVFGRQVWKSVTRGDNGRSLIRTLVIFSIFLGLVASLILCQPDFGTLLLVGSLALGLLFAAGGPWWYFALVVPAAAALSSLLVFLSPYRRARLLTFLGQGSADPLGSGYQIIQVLIALGSGGLLGLGFGNSRQKYGYIPEVATDSIFAVIGEELGWVGSVVLLSAFLFLLWRGLRVAQQAPDLLGRLLSVGVVLWVGLQALLNLGAVTALLPFTGMPLPLISYGGSSLIFGLAGLGLLLGISKETR